MTAVVCPLTLVTGKYHKLDRDGRYYRIVGKKKEETRTRIRWAYNTKRNVRTPMHMKEKTSVEERLVKHVGARDKKVHAIAVMRVQGYEGWTRS